MNLIIKKLEKILNQCRYKLNKGYANAGDGGLPWLNSFCFDFLQFTRDLHKFLVIKKQTFHIESRQFIENIYLCLMQIVTCIKHMEYTLKIEDEQRIVLLTARQYFLDRINWCFDRMWTTLIELSQFYNNNIPERTFEEMSFVDLMNLILHQLSPYSNYQNKLIPEISDINVSKALVDSKQIRSIANAITRHVLAFANVALQDDKIALSALCQRVIRDCINFQEQCQMRSKTLVDVSDSDRKLIAISLENALYHLEDYINESILRLIFYSFCDFRRLSVPLLKETIKQREVGMPNSESALDEFIADFDVNIDRTTQIGILATCFESNVKTRILLRNCLASFESLDSCFIPTLQTAKGTNNFFSDILVHHFQDEVEIFQKTVQKIIDSQAFTSCYYDLLNQTLKANDKQFDKIALYEIAQMGDILREHFCIPINRKTLLEFHNGLEMYEKFCIVLNECHSVLNYVNILEPHRILKRFKMLRSMVRKLIDIMNKTISQSSSSSPLPISSPSLPSISASSSSLLSSTTTTSSSSPSSSTSSSSLSLPSASPKEKEIILKYKETTKDHGRKIASVENELCRQSILYETQRYENKKRKRCKIGFNYQLNSIGVQLPLTPLKISLTSQMKYKLVRKSNERLPKQQEIINERKNSAVLTQQYNRKNSLRRVIFKRHNNIENMPINNDDTKEESYSLQISEILDELTNISSDISNIS